MKKLNVQPLELPATSTTRQAAVMWFILGLLLLVGRSLLMLICAAVFVAVLVALAAAGQCGSP